MRSTFLLVTTLFLVCCASPPESLSSESASAEEFRSYIGYKNYVRVKYEKNGETHNEILIVKYKNKVGFGKSRDNLIAWESLLFAKKLNKQSSEFSEGLGSAFIVSPFL